MNIFDRVERMIAMTLLIMMGVVVAVAYEVFKGMASPPGLFLGVAELLDVFGLFLMVLIGLELMTSIRMYLDDHKIHAEMMLLVAITAVTRKIVIMESSSKEPLLLFGIGFLIIALALGYYPIKQNRPASDS